MKYNIRNDKFFTDTDLNMNGVTVISGEHWLETSFMLDELTKGLREKKFNVRDFVVSPENNIFRILKEIWMSTGKECQVQQLSDIIQRENVIKAEVLFREIAALHPDKELVEWYLMDVFLGPDRKFHDFTDSDPDKKYMIHECVEAGLHPEDQIKYVDNIIKFVKDGGTTVVTTVSPFVLQRFIQALPGSEVPNDFYLVGKGEGVLLGIVNKTDHTNDMFMRLAKTLNKLVWGQKYSVN